MKDRILPLSINTFLLCSLLIVIGCLMIGCGDMNRKHFTSLEPTKTENGSQQFDYKASSGSAVLTCAPGTKNCTVDKSGRAVWPVGDKEAEKTRMEWLEKNLADQGYKNADYEVVSREPILTATSMYDISYVIKVKTR